MKKLLQSMLLGVYRAVNVSGVLSTRPGRSLFEWGYHRYKRLLEAGDIRALAGLIKPGTIVIDVGANIGFFTRFFAGCVSGDGKVLAIEPERTNFSRLNEMVKKHGLNGKVETFEAVAASKSGTLKLKINPLHPADHKISEEGIPVKAISLDGVLADRNWPPVSLIKIDVQGAEVMVLQGAEETLKRFGPALYLEVDDDSLRRMNTNAEALFLMVEQCGYGIHRIINRRVSLPMERQEAVGLCQGGNYADFLCIQDHKASGDNSSGTQPYQTTSSKEPGPTR